MVYVDTGDQFGELKRHHTEYTVFDESYERLGKVDELFVVEGERLAYIGISNDLLGTSLTPIPVEIIRVNDKRQVVVIEDSRANLERAPIMKNEDEMSFELEARIRGYFGLGPEGEPIPETRHAPPDAKMLEDLAPDDRIDIAPGERKDVEELEMDLPPRPEPPSFDVPDLRDPPGTRRRR